MPEISNKKKKFIKRNFQHLSIEELADETSLKPSIIRSLIDQYSAEVPGKDPYLSKKLISNKDLLKKRSLKMIGIGAIVIFVLTCLVYTPSLKNDFVWDDVSYVTKNTLIRSLSIHSLYEMLTSFSVGNWHPLTTLSLAIDYAFWGLNPLGYHLTNIILHGLNTLLAFFLTIKLIVKEKVVKEMLSPPEMPISISTKTLTVAGVTALLFGIHPLHVESVAWVAERKDLLCALFFLLTLLFYLSYTSSVAKGQQWIWFNTCLLLFIFALMSKPMAVTLPVILLLLDIYPLKRIRLHSGKNLSVFLEKIPFFALSISSSIITIIAQHAGGAIKSLEQFHLNTRLLNALSSLVFYLEKLIVPVKLIPFYPFSTHAHWLDLQYLSSGILVLAITGCCVWMVRQGNYLFFTAWSYYVITLLPVLGIIQVGGQAAADRYTYLPSLSIFLLIGIVISYVFERSALIKHKSMLGGLVLAFIFIFMLLGQLTIKQIKIWRNSEILWSHVIFHKSTPLAHNNLGNAYYEKGELDKAIYEYKQALILKPLYADAHSNLGATFIRKGIFNEAISECKKALAINPNYAEAHKNLGTAYFEKGELNKAISEYKRAIAIKPGNAKAHYNLGKAYRTKGRLDEAISQYKKALAINPNYAEAHNNLSVAYYYNGNYKLAIVHCDKVVSLGHIANPKLLELLKPYR